jgi:hypothetical protein
MLENWDQRPLPFSAFAFFAAKSIVTAANYGKPRSPGSAASLRSIGGTAMHWAIRHLAVFILDIQLNQLCCATLEF